MADLTVPVKIDGFECVEEIAQAVLSWTYKGKTLKEWADSISEPKTNADRIRAMSDEELAVWIAETANCSDWCILNEKCKSKPDNEACPNVWLEWLKEEYETN